ncbi:MAG: fibrobacter succinogenes major paralogous domain-containing protein [Bacteroidales bacterium]|nr:fibrobacter succinogenes major paralogous domain-containing protein [Bacteroidales bacterium]
MKPTNFKYLIFLFTILFFFNSCKKDSETGKLNGLSDAKFNPGLSYGQVQDIDGNVYKTIQIGDQIWMAENLRTIHYRNGDPIKNVENSDSWITLTTGAYCNYENTFDKNEIATRGRLYNWYAVSDSRKIAPSGWHVPTDEDWKILVGNLGGDSVAGGKMKEEGTFHWNSENVGANNESGFTALPSGYRDQYYGSFSGINYNAFWWTSTEDSETHSWYRYLNNQLTSVGRFSWDVGNKKSGFSVRCVKD